MDGEADWGVRGGREGETSPTVGSFGHEPGTRKSHEPPEDGEEDDGQGKAVRRHSEAYLEGPTDGWMERKQEPSTIAFDSRNGEAPPLSLPRPHWSSEQVLQPDSSLRLVSACFVINQCFGASAAQIDCDCSPPRGSEERGNGDCLAGEGG